MGVVGDFAEVTRAHMTTKKQVIRYSEDHFRSIRQVSLESFG
jgi:hypothetical protein